MAESLDLVAALRQPLQALLDPQERIFWPFLLGSLCLPWLVMGLRRGTAALRGGLLNRAIWGHASARADLTLYFVKTIGFALVRVPWLAATAGLALWLGVTLSELLGPAQTTSLSRTSIAVLYTVVLFAVWDFSRFALHVAMHRFCVLWSFHQVHHSAQVLTPLTLYRTHPVETLLYDLRGVLSTGLVTGVFLYLFRGSAIELELLGINALGFVFSALGANLRHSHVWLRFGFIERWLLSPAQHQLHHGRDLRHQHSNFGTWIALWDRLLGTWAPAPKTAPGRYGIERANHRFDSVISMLVGPLREVARRVGPTAAAVMLLLASRRVQAEAPAPETQTPPTNPRAVDPIEPPSWPEDESSPEEPPEPTEPVPSEPAPSEPVPSEPAPSEPAPTDSVDEADDGVDFELELPEDDTPSAAQEPAQPGAAETSIEIEPEPEADIALEQISILGTPEARASIAGSAHVIGEEELQKKEYDDIHRVLRTVPGVYMREEDGFGLRPNIGMRGASSDRSAKITLMEDGILLAPAPYSAPAAYYFPLVTRVVGVEVFKGPASIRFGPNTIGGALNLQTRPIPQENSGYIDAALGMRRYGKVHGWWGTTYKRFGVLLEAARIQSDGFKEIDGGGETGFDKNDFMIKGRWSSDPNRRWFHQVDVKGGFGTERSYETYLGLTQADFEADPYRRYAASSKGRMKWWRSQAEAGYFVARGSIFDLQLRAYRHDFDRAWRKFNRFRGADPADVLRSPDMGTAAVYYAILSGQADSLTPEQTLLIGTNDRRFQVNGGTAVAHIRPTWRWLEQDIEIGARVHHDEIQRHHTEDGFNMVSGTLVPEGTPTATTTRNRGSAVAAAFHLLDTVRIKWFSVMPGARVEVIRTQFDDRLTEQSTSNTNAVFIPGIGLHAQATDWLGFLAGVHSGFSPVAPGQPDEVEPERSINYEAGARIEHATKRTLTRAEAIGFFNDYSNLTSVCTFSSGCDENSLDRQFNAGRVFVYGLESLISERFTLPKNHFVEASIVYTYTGSNFRTSFSSASPQLGDVQRGDELAYVPEHLATANLGVGGAIWGVYGSGVYVGQMRDTAGQGSIPEQERIPRHFVLDLSGQVSPTPRATLYLTIHNLTNNAYMVSRRPFGARPGIPFQLMGGFKYQF